MNRRLEEHLNTATESALGRFVYKFVMPGTFALLAWLGLRAINALDTAIDELQAASQAQTQAQAEIQGDVQAIRAQMDYQVKYQELVDQKQNEELDRHARALRLK